LEQTIDEINQESSLRLGATALDRHSLSPLQLEEFKEHSIVQQDAISPRPKAPRLAEKTSRQRQRSRQCSGGDDQTAPKFSYIGTTPRFENTAGQQSQLDKSTYSNNDTSMFVSEI
jgi:hypothetical protein